jgi:hypothetical protein
VNGWLVLADVAPDDARTQVLLDFANSITSLAVTVVVPISAEAVLAIARESGIHIEEEE